MRAKLNNIKKKFLIYGGVASAVLLSYHVADKYFNRGSAEENLRTHIQTLYNKQPDAVKCANVDSSNYDSRVTCEARMGDTTKVYLCKGFLDGFDNSCIAPKIAGRL
tara:strand:- start:396 stop:716 length:321 start_codon:yes stop_codon:yes gene_type:complete